MYIKNCSYICINNKTKKIMVTLREIIEKAKTRLSSDTRRHYTPDDYYALAEELGVYDWISDDTSDNPVIESVYVEMWYCTDTYVGVKVYFLGKEPLCISKQTGRKMSEEFEFFNKEIAIKCRNYLLSRTSNDGVRLIDVSELDKEIPETYQIQYSTQILFKYALFENRPVQILKRANYYKNDPIFGDEKFHGVLVKDESGVEILTSTDCLLFRYNQEIDEKPLPINK